MKEADAMGDTIFHRIMRREGFADAGYRVVVNCNGDGGQTVFQLHLHLLAGAPLDGFGVR